MEGLLSPAHLIIILVIVLILFGAGKLPELGKIYISQTRKPRQATVITIVL